MGDFSKASAIELYLENFSDEKMDDCMFFGDSLNDESVFGLMKNCVGVSNISKVEDQLKKKPATILKGKKNEEIHGVFNYLKDQLK